MPIIQKPDYSPPFPFKWTHFNTVYPALFRSVPELNYKRELLPTKDGDILNLDWLKDDKKQIVVCLHGLEGKSDRHYIKGMLHRFQSAGWDGLAFNFRSCGEPANKRLRSYNMGATEDLHFLIKHIIKKGYETIVLVGFSLGGNMLLKYMGEGGDYLPKQVKAAVAISVPCYIPTANIKIDHWENRAYLNRFMKTLNAKIIEKEKSYPEKINLPDKMPQSFQEFDAYYTGPIHGYSGAMDYWESCSSLHFLANIRRPCLLLNALDDTFLSKECYPYDHAKHNIYFHLEAPKYGGHCGFYNRKNKGFYYSENRALAFIEEMLK